EAGMTPRTHRITALGAGLLVATLAFMGATAHKASAQESTDLNDPITLQGRTVAERMVQLRDEFKERQRETREMLAARRHHKAAHGKKAQQAFNDDYVGLPSN